MSLYRPLDCDKLGLVCSEQNAHALAFYQKYGFHTIGTEAGAYGTAVPDAERHRLYRPRGPDVKTIHDFLPVSKEDLLDREWYYYDFLLITGDAYVDHPSFGPAIICRVLEAEGYRVAVLAQPDWRRLRRLYRPGPAPAGGA